MNLEDLARDIKRFWNVRQNRVALADEKYLQIENELEVKVADFRKSLPKEYHKQLTELEEICANKRYQSNDLVYQQGFTEGIKTFLFTLCYK